MLACKDSFSAVGAFGGVVGSRNKLGQCPCTGRDRNYWHVKARHRRTNKDKKEKRSKKKKKTKKGDHVLISNEAANGETTPTHTAHQTAAHVAACKRLAPGPIGLVAGLI